MTDSRSEQEGAVAPFPTIIFEEAYQAANRRSKCSRKDFAAGYRAALEQVFNQVDTWLTEVENEPVN